MDEFQCECGQILSSKFNLSRHKYGSNCSLKKSNSKSNKKRIFRCRNKPCKSTFARSDHLTRHLKICKFKPVTKKTTKIKSDNNNTGIGDMHTNIGDQTGDNNKINIDNSTNKKGDVNINLIIFGKDGPASVITNISELINSNCNIFEKLIETVNFDPEKPQHHNVYCSDLKSGVGHVYEKDGWNTKCISEVLNKILDSKTSDIIKTLEMNGDVLNDRARNKLKSAIDEAREAIIGHDGKTYPPGTRKQLMRYIKQIIYNKRNIVINTKKKLVGTPKRKNVPSKYSESNSESNSESECESSEEIKSKAKTKSKSKPKTKSKFKPKFKPKYVFNNDIMDE